MQIVRRTGLEAVMEDGTVLVADAWHPDASDPAHDGRWPVLLQRLPYGRSVASTPVLPHPEWFARRGYAVVVQDCRGRGDSGGTFSPFVDEGADGAATIAWAARLAFCDGRVATYGFSYQGLGQLYAAARHPPSLHAIAPMMCSPDPFEGWTYESGLLRWPFVCFWAAQLAGQGIGTGPIPFDLDAWPREQALGADPPPWFVEWLAHSSDDSYWAARRPDIGAIAVPAFTVLGWFDDFSSGTAQLISRLGAEAWCGPWAHMPWGTRHGGVEFGAPASPAPVWDALVGFFDRVFRHDATTSDVAVRYFVIGDGWRAASQWPPPHEIETWYGTSATGNANSRWGDGRLGTARPEHDVASVLVDEPTRPSPGAPLDFQDDSPAQERRDVLCYTSDGFESPVVVAGSPVVRAATQSDAPGHDLVAVLSLVAPDGSARALSSWGARGGPTARSLEPFEWHLQLRPIAVRIAPGERLRLALSGSRFPCYDRRAGGVATLRISSVSIELPVVTSG